MDRGAGSPADIEPFAAALRDSVANGVISLDEFEAKLGAVYAAQTAAELEALVPGLRASPARRYRSKRAIGVAGAILVLVMVSVASGWALRSPKGTAAASSVSHASSVSPVPSGTPSGGVLAPAATGGAGPSIAPIATSSTVPSVSPYPGNGVVALLSVDTRGRTLTVDIWAQDVRYSTCDNFDALTWGGASVGLAGLMPGDFATLSTNASGLCVTSVRVVEPPTEPQCSGSGYGGDGTVLLLGSNSAAHSVTYRGVDSTFTQAVRWCNAPTVVGADQRAEALSAILPGTVVTLNFSGTGWVTTIGVGRP